jgi:hypothetical protein
MTARGVGVVAVCLLLAVAGCTAPTADAPMQTVDAPGMDDPTTETASSTPTTTEDGGNSGGEAETVAVTGDLAVNATRTFRRVRGLLGTEFAPTTVVERDLTAAKSSDLSRVPFFRAFGVTSVSLNESQPAGLTTVQPVVYVSPADAGPERVEQVLAHEFVHVAQVRERMVPWFGGVLSAARTLDERFARRALVEGGAVYVTDAYTRDHQPGLQLQSAHVADQYAAGAAADRFVWGQYLFGYRYVNATIDAPSALASVYDDAPETSENILHPGERDARTPLDVSVDTTEFSTARSATERAGEFATRLVLRSAANRSVVREAAAGWGNDHVEVFETGGQQSVAWVTRWDTTADADEFERAARSLTNTSDYHYRTTRLSEDTVVVFAGTEAFVDTAEAGGNVTITT